MRKLSLKSNLGMAITIGAICLIGIIIALLLRFTPIGFLDFDALALTDSDIAQNLKTEELSDDKKIIEPKALPVFSPLFERAGAIFGGEEKTRLNSNFPVYTEDSAVLMMLSDDARLITKDLERVSTYRNLYVSDGVTFNRDRERADVDMYSLLSVSGGVYINLSRAEIAGTVIPMNSVQYFTENHIAFYKPQDKKFVYQRIDGLDENSTIRIGDRLYNYYDLLRGLGLMGSNHVLDEEEILELEEEVIEPEEVVEVEAEKPKLNSPKPAAPADTGVKPPPRVSIHLSPVQCFIGYGFNKGYMTTRLSVLDRGGLVNSDINVYLYQGDELIASYTLPLSEFTGKGNERVSRDIRVNQLEQGKVYKIFGTYTFVEDGQTKTVIFDEQTFIFERPQTDIPPTPPLPVGYVKPDVKLGPYVGDIYFIDGMQYGYDPAMRIKGGVQYEIYRLSESSTKTFLRKVVAVTPVAEGAAPIAEPTHLGPLPPGESYMIKAYYNYMNERGQMMQVDLGEKIISTLPLPSDAKIKINYSLGDIYSNMIRFTDVGFDLGVSDARLLEVATRVAVHAKGGVTDPGKEYTPNSTATKSMKAGTQVLYDTPRTLNSHTYYDFEWRVYDPFGNQLPLADPYKGQTRTSSAPPTASITVAPSAGSTKVTIRVMNPDNVDLSNCWIAFYEMVNGVQSSTPVMTQLKLPSGYGQPQSRYGLSPTTADWTYTLDIANFRLDCAYVAEIRGDFDLGDGPNNTPNPHTQELLASKQFTATTLRSLGSVVFNTTIKSVSDSGAVVLENVNRFAMQDITLSLLSRVTFNIYRADDLATDPDTAPLMHTVTIDKLKPEDATAWTNMMDPLKRFENIIDNIYSKTEYKIVIVPEILICDDYYVLPAITDIDTFYTLKRQPTAVIANGDILPLTDAIYIFDAIVDDPDGAIINNTVSVLVVDGSQRPVFSANIETNKPYDFSILGLETGDNFTITFTAPAYNEAYSSLDYTSYRANVRLKTLPKGTGDDENVFSGRVDNSPTPEYYDCYKVTTENAISGILSLRGMDIIAGNDLYLDTKFRTEITDTAQYLKPTPTEPDIARYTLRFYSNPGYGPYEDAGVMEFTFDNWTQNLVDNQIVKLQKDLYFRTELWITINNRAIMLDEVFFDTKGPMTPIYTMDQMRWLNGQTAPSGEDLTTKPMRPVAISGTTTWEWPANTPADLVANDVPDGFGDDELLTSAVTGGRYGRYLVVNDLYHFYGNLTDVDTATLAGYDLKTIMNIVNDSRVSLTDLPATQRQNYIRGTNVNNPNGSTTPFMGTIDFQGHKIVFDVHTRSNEEASDFRQIIQYIGYSGVVKNLELVYGLYGDDPGESSQISPFYSNRGHIENVRVKSVADNSRYNFSYSPLLYSNGVSGVVNNFTIDLGEGVSARNGFGGAVYTNSGTVSNGYIYGSEKGEPIASDSPADRSTRSKAREASRHGRITVPIVPKAEGTGFAVSNIGGAVGVNNATGRVNSVYSLVDVFVNNFGTTNRTFNPQSVGSVVGVNNGRVDSIYSVGEVYFNTSTNSIYKAGIHPTSSANDYVYGPSVGSAAGSARTNNSYYIPSDSSRTYKGAWGSKTAADTLHDYLWQQRMLGNSFEASKTVTAGFFPQLIQSINMPAQPYIPLPGLDVVERVEISSVFVEKQMENYAIALVTLKNKSTYQIRGFSVGSLTATVVDGSQIDVNGVTRVQVRLDNPTEYKSGYTLNEFTYSPMNSSIHYPMSVSNMTIDAEFYKMIYTTEDWADINRNNLRSWNYRLGANIDFTGIAPVNISLGTYGAALSSNVFSGKLDGGYYDEDYNLLGTYTISGIDLSPSTITNGVAVIPTLWGGTVSNLQVDGMRINKESSSAINSSHAGFIANTSAGAKIDNVHLRNCYVQATTYVGSLVAVLDYTDVTNCSVNSSTVRDASNSMLGGAHVGGFVGVVGNASTIWNSYVYGINVQIENTDKMLGVGGFVGRFNSGEITNVYAHGQIRVISFDANIGGLIGYRDSNDRMLENCWVDVNVNTRSNNAGGLIGSASTMRDFADVNALVLGDIQSELSYIPEDDDRPVRRIVGTTGGNNEAVGIKGPIAGAFFYEKQMVATQPYSDWLAVLPADTHQPGPGLDGAQMATADDLKKKDYYLGVIRMGEDFIYDEAEFESVFPDFDGIQSGQLPLLRNTSGGLLPFQTVHKPAEHEYSILVTEAEIDQNNPSNRIVVMTVEHPPGMGAYIESLDIANVSIIDPSSAYDILFDTNPGSTHTQILLTLTLEDFDKYVDTYAITKIYLKDPAREEVVSSRIIFDPINVPYLYIPSAADWRDLMAENEHGQTTENIEVSGDLDFTSISLGTAVNVKVNRLKGTDSARIRNLNIQFDERGMGFINHVNAAVQDILFENIKIEQIPAGGMRTGIISQCTGTVSRLNFKDIELKTNGASYAGSIGYLRGNVNDVTLKNIRVDGRRTEKINQTAFIPQMTVGKQDTIDNGNASYIGGLIGYGVDSEISNVRLSYDDSATSQFTNWGAQLLGEQDLTLAKNPNIMMGRVYVGGIAGALYTSRISDCSTEYTSVYGEIVGSNNATGAQTTSDSYVGGMVGSTTGAGSNPRNERLSVNHVRVISEGNRVGGIFGYGHSFSTVNQPTKVSNAVIIAAGTNVGGFSGAWADTSANIEVTNVYAFGRAGVGGLAGTNTNYVYGCSVRDSFVGSIFDNAAITNPTDPTHDWVPLYNDANWSGRGIINAAGASLPNTNRMTKSYSTAYNRNYGGFAGVGRAYSSSVVNTRVGGADADYVGGAVGLGDNSAHNFNQVLDTTVYGRNYIGGITGYLPKFSIAYNASNATVIGTGDFVGGLAGAMKPDQALDGSNTAYTRNNIVSGKIKGNNFVGGLVGRVDGNLYPNLDSLVYYYANMKASSDPIATANNASITQQYSMLRDRDNIMVGNVKVTASGGTGSLLYNYNTPAPTNETMGNRIWEYSVLDLNGTAEFAKDLKNGSGTDYAYKYASVDGEYDPAVLSERSKGNRADLGTPNSKESPLHSSENLLLTRKHFLGTYSDVGVRFAYSIRTAPIYGAEGLVTNWVADTTSFTSNDANVMGTPGQVNGATGSGTTARATTGGVASMRQVYRVNYGTGQNEPSYWWYEGFRKGYLPYTTTQLYYFHRSPTVLTPALISPRSQAPYSEGSIGGVYQPVAYTPFIGSPSTDPAQPGWWVNATGWWRPFESIWQTDKSPNSSYYSMRAFAEGYTAAWRDKPYTDVIVDRNYTGGIKIPMDPTDVAAFGFSIEMESPEATIYAVSADKFNIDFEENSTGAFSIQDAVGSILYNSSIENRTYTFTYDYKSKLKLVIAFGGASKTIEIDPSVLARTISVHGNDWYHLSGGGVYAGSHEGDALIPGTFVNLMNGEALHSDGKVYNLATNNVVRTTTEVELCEDAIPLHTFEFEGTTIKTFANYSVTGTGESQQLRLYVKDGRLSAISPTMPVSPDAMILDYKDSGVDPATAPEIMTVLGGDGVIADLKEPVVLPDGFRTDFVREMTNTMSSDLTIALVRYKSGRVVGFNYMTGEEIPLDADMGEGSLIAYARTVLSDNASSMFATISGSYASLYAAEAGIRSGHLPSDGLGTADPGGSGISGGTSMGGATGGTGSNATDETNTTVPVTGTGTGISEATGENTGSTGGVGLGGSGIELSGGEPVEGQAVEGAGTNAGTDGSIYGLSTEAGEAVSGEAEALGDEEASGTGVAGEVGTPAPEEAYTGGDLSRPTKAPSIVSVYNIEDGKYHVYDAGSLTGTSNARPMTTIDIEEIDASYMLERMQSFGAQRSDRGLMMLGGIAVVVAVLLIYISIKRRRLTK